MNANEKGVPVSKTVGGLRVLRKAAGFWGCLSLLSSAVIIDVKHIDTINDGIAIS